MKSYLDNDYKVITLPDNGVPIKPIRAKLKPLHQVLPV